MLSVEKLCKKLGDLALKDISFEVRRRSYLVLLGESGAGKSVLLEIIAGLTSPDSGRVLLDGEDITDEKIQSRNIGLVFQAHALFPHMSVYDNIAYPLRCKRLDASSIRTRVMQLADEVGASGLLWRSPTTLSGGEIQRVSLARALASGPRCLLLDEPLSSLDTKARAQMRTLLRRIHRRADQAIVHVTHDYTEAVSLATHVAVMEQGTVVQTGTVDEVLRRPRSEFVARFVGIKNFFKGTIEQADGGKNGLKRFRADGIEFYVPAEKTATNGLVCIRGEDITLLDGPDGDREAVKQRSGSGEVNILPATVLDIVPAGQAVEVIVGIGRGRPVELAAVVTAQSTERLGLRCGKKLCASFKTSAVKYLES